MSHTMRTQAEIYDLTSREESSAKVAKKMEAEMRGEEVLDLITMEVGSDEIKLAGSVFGSSISSISHGRKSFTVEHSNLVLKIFKNCITNKATPTQCELKSIIHKGTPEEAKLLKVYSRKQIYDKIRLFIRKS